MLHRVRQRVTNLFFIQGHQGGGRRSTASLPVVRIVDEYIGKRAYAGEAMLAVLARDEVPVGAALLRIDPAARDAILTRLSRGAPTALEPNAVAALERYPFPGNVRELENILERGLSLAADPLPTVQLRPVLVMVVD